MVKLRVKTCLHRTPDITSPFRLNTPPTKPGSTNWDSNPLFTTIYDSDGRLHIIYAPESTNISSPGGIYRFVRAGPGNQWTFQDTHWKESLPAGSMIPPAMDSTYTPFSQSGVPVPSRFSNGRLVAKAMSDGQLLLAYAFIINTALLDGVLQLISVYLQNAPFPFDTNLMPNWQLKHFIRPFIRDASKQTFIEAINVAIDPGSERQDTDFVCVLGGDQEEFSLSSQMLSTSISPSRTEYSAGAPNKALPLPGGVTAFTFGIRDDGSPFYIPDGNEAPEGQHLLFFKMQSYFSLDSQARAEWIDAILEPVTDDPSRSKMPSGNIVHVFSLFKVGGADRYSLLYTRSRSLDGGTGILNGPSNTWV
jgi:hypothetical protein